MRQGRRERQSTARLGKAREQGEGEGNIVKGAYIENADVVVYQVFHHFDLMLTFAICLEEAGSKKQRQVLGTHLIEVSTSLHPGSPGKREFAMCDQCHGIRNQEPSAPSRPAPNTLWN